MDEVLMYQLSDEEPEDDGGFEETSARDEEMVTNYWCFIILSFSLQLLLLVLTITFCTYFFTTNLLNLKKHFQ